MNYRLKDRLYQLPKIVYQAIYDECMALPKGGNAQRWKTIVEDTATDIRGQEALIMCKHIGCTLEELLNPDADLLKIWQRVKKDPVEKERGKKFGLGLAAAL